VIRVLPGSLTPFREDSRCEPILGVAARRVRAKNPISRNELARHAADALCLAV